MNIGRDASIRLMVDSSAGLTTFEGKEIIERHLCRECRIIDRPLKYSEIKNYIDKNRPITITYEWKIGSAHAMIISGYSEVDGKKMILLNDPMRDQNIETTYYNLKSGRYTCDLEENELRRDLETKVHGYWSDSLVILESTFGIFEEPHRKENQENIDPNYSI